MAEDHSGNRVTAFDCEILRGAFRRSVVERRVAERDRRQNATLLARELTEIDDVDDDIVDWILRK